MSLEGVVMIAMSAVAKFLVIKVVIFHATRNALETV
jgi:hypothetical protein